MIMRIITRIILMTMTRKSRKRREEGAAGDENEDERKGARWQNLGKSN